MSVPTKGETYYKLMEHLRLAQEDAAMLMHLNNAEGDGPGMVLARGWWHVTEQIKKMQGHITALAKRGLQ
jgi:hypothetical protein